VLLGVLKERYGRRGTTTKRQSTKGPPSLCDDGKIGNDRDYGNYGERRRGEGIWRSSLALDFMVRMGDLLLDGELGRGVNMRVMRGVYSVQKRMFGVLRLAR
jgi:hypothetical protein